MVGSILEREKGQKQENSVKLPADQKAQTNRSDPIIGYKIIM